MPRNMPKVETGSTEIGVVENFYIYVKYSIFRTIQNFQFEENT